MIGMIAAGMVCLDVIVGTPTSYRGAVNVLAAWVIIASVEEHT